MAIAFNIQQLKQNVVEFANGYKIFAFEAETTPSPTNTRLMYPTYQDSVVGTNGFTSITLSAYGRGIFWVKGPTKLLLTDEAGNYASPIWELDNVDAAGTNIIDANGNTVLAFEYVPNATNYIVITNAQSGDTPLMSVEGVDVDIDIAVSGKGTGKQKWMSDINPNGQQIIGDMELVGDFDITGNMAITGNLTVSGNVDISGALNLFKPGFIMDYAGVTAPTGWLEQNGAAINRITYSALFAVMTATEAVTLTSSSTTFAVSSATNYYIGMAIEGTGVPIATTISNIVGTTITMSNAATISGASVVRFFCAGNGDGSTTFNLYNKQRRTSVGRGGSGSATLGNVPGQTGGEEAHALTSAENGPHTHTYTAPQGNSSFTSGGAAGSTNITVGVATSSSGSGTAHNNIQPSIVFMSIVKT